MPAINWITFGERVVAKDHPTLPDVANRPLREVLTNSGYSPDSAALDLRLMAGSTVHLDTGTVTDLLPVGVGNQINPLRLGYFTNGNVDLGFDSYLANVGTQPGMAQADLSLIGMHDAADPRIIFEGIAGRGKHGALLGLQANDIMTMFKTDGIDSNGAQVVGTGGMQFLCEVTATAGKVPTGIYFFTMNSTGSIGNRWIIGASGRFTPFTDNLYDFGNGGNGNPAPQRIKTVYAMQVFAELGDGGFQVLNANNGAAANTATLTNAPIAGNPTFWLKIAVNNAFKWIACW